MKGFKSFTKNSDNISIICHVIECCIKKKKLIDKPILIYEKVYSNIILFSSFLKKLLGRKFPFVKISGILHSTREIDQIKELAIFQKKSIGICISEYIEYYEGEVFGFSSKPNIFNSCEKDLNAVLELRTLEGKLKLKISGIICKELLKKKVQIGDVIRIVPEIFSVQILGKSINFVRKSEISNNYYLTTPKGKVLKKKILVKELTLFDFDLENCKDNNNFEFLSLENTEKLNTNTENLLSNYFELGKAKIYKGVLFIENAHDLNQHSLRFLTKTSGNWANPLTILSSNRIDLINPEKFLLKCSRWINLNNWYIVPLQDFSRGKILQTICTSFLNRKQFISGKAVKLIGLILRTTNLEYIASLVSISYIAVNQEKLSWICKYTLDFFKYIILDSKEHSLINSSKISFLALSKSL
jgi:RuvB-like protein 1 (pontin 52)